MTSKTFCIVAGVLSAAVLLLNVGQSHAQTPGAICEFDATGICEVDSPIFDNGGLIGIGTTSPGVKLHLAGTDAVGYAATIQLQNQNAGGANAFITASDNFWDAGAAKLLFGIGATGPFSTNVKMVIDSFGNVGIGTVNPDAALDVLAPSRGVNAVSSTSDGVVGVTFDPSHAGVVAVSANGVSTNLGLRVLGTFTATGTKNAVVPLQDGQHVLLTAEESTEVWFSDYGSAQLVNGRAVVQIDRVYLQTVNTEKDYHVFLTARGNPTGALYIDQETPSSFEIRESTGTANIKVSYRIVAKRKDFADERLKKVDAPLAYQEPTSKDGIAARPDLHATEQTASLP